MTRGIEGLVAFPHRRSFERDGRRVRLCPQQFTLAFILCAVAPQTVTYDDIFSAFWGEPEDGGPLGPRRLINVRATQIRLAFEKMGIAIKCNFGRGMYAIDLYPAQNTPCRQADVFRAIHLSASPPSVLPMEGQIGCDSRRTNSPNSWIAA